MPEYKLGALFWWPESELPDAIRELALRTGLIAEPAAAPAAAGVEAIAASMGLEAQAAEIPYADLERHLSRIGPAILQIPGAGVLAILSGGRSSVTVIGRDRKLRQVRRNTVRAAVCRELEAGWIEQTDELLVQASIPESKRPRCREAILRERFGAVRIGGVWLLRLSPGADFLRQLRFARIPRRVLALAGLHAFQYAVWVGGWWLIGAAAFAGHFERAWLIAWALLLLTLAPCRIMITWLQGTVAISAGALLKQRLFWGALHLEPDSIRHQGIGQLLGRVIESNAVEALALSGGFLGLVAVIELAFAAGILAYGAGGAIHVIALLGWIALTAMLGWLYYRHYQSWTDARLWMSYELIENMVGYRTRLAQQPPANWHAEEDASLENYLDRSRALDRLSSLLAALIPRGWIVIGLGLLFPAIQQGAGAVQLGIAIGGILLAFRALKRFSSGLSQLLAAGVAWRRVSGLMRQGSRLVAAHGSDPIQGAPIIQAHNLVFRYRQDLRPVLDNCTLRLLSRDRVILEGASGGGKSSLVSILIGLRIPESGSLAIAGIERKQVSPQAWRRSVAAAPQFHDNHVLAETFAFNLLMGRDCVPGPVEMKEAAEICAEMGLGELLQRMPAGMLQMVGETGWQLSHGERSRLYIARALLQNAELVVLDESFAALDPENLKMVIECVLKRSRALLVIAHR